MRFCILISILILSVGLNAQENCATSLKKAQKYFETGNIEAIEPLILTCIENGFSKDEKMQAYKLLINSNLYGDNLAKAEEYMLKFLKLNPEYQINKAIDGAEFIHLFQSYNTKPFCLLGAGIGSNLSYVRIKETFSVYSLNRSDIQYTSPGPGLNAFVSLTLPILENLNLNVDVQFAQNKLEYKNTSFNNQIILTETQTKISFPVSASYCLIKIGKFKPFAQLGVNPGILLSDNADIKRTYLDNSHNEIAGSGINMLKLRNKNTMDLMVGAGINYLLKKGQISLLLRYDIGLSSIVDGKNKNVEYDLIYKYNYMDPDFFMSNLSFRVGYYYPLYNLKKKKS